MYESLAETYKLIKDKTNAIRYFEMARELDPQNLHWTYMIEKVAVSHRAVARNLPGLIVSR